MNVEDVFFKQGPLVECLLTNVAFKVSRVFVNIPHVLNQDRTVLESIPTNCTLGIARYFVLLMNIFDVRFQVAFLSERLWANLARIVLLVFMNSFRVFDQIAQL